MANDWVTQKLDEEQAEVGMISAIKNWRRAGLGDEHLLNVIIAAHPSLILNMMDRVNSGVKRTMDALADDTFKVETKVTKFK